MAGVRGFKGVPGHLRVPWGQVGLWSGTPAYWKDPIGAHGLTDALRDAELLRVPSWPPPQGATRRGAMDRYHQTRNQLSIPLFDVVDTIAGLQWTDAEIPELLLRLNSAMTDEVDLLARLDDEPALAGRR